MKESNNESWLVLRAQSGDIEAMNLLLESIQRPLLRYIRHVVQNEALAEEILQESFVAIYRKLQWLQEPDLFRPWCYRIASRETGKQLKRESKHSRNSSPEPQEIFSNQQSHESGDQEWIARLPELLSEVSPASRAVLVLHYLEEMKLNEISEALDVSIGTIKSRLAYGLTMLRKQVNIGRTSKRSESNGT